MDFCSSLLLFSCPICVQSKPAHVKVNHYYLGSTDSITEPDTSDTFHPLSSRGISSDLLSHARFMSISQRACAVFRVVTGLITTPHLWALYHDCSRIFYQLSSMDQPSLCHVRFVANTIRSSSHTGFPC